MPDIPKERYVKCCITGEECSPISRADLANLAVDEVRGAISRSLWLLTAFEICAADGSLNRDGDFLFERFSLNKPSAESTTTCMKDRLS
jgi:hypothetical protein